MARKKPSVPLPVPGTMTPEDRDVDLPLLALASAPRTPAEALDAACDFAATHASNGNDKTLVGSAYRALMAAHPGLGKAYVLERLAGIDRLETYLAAGNTTELHP